MAARHLWHYGYRPTIYYPKRGKNEIYEVTFTVLNAMAKLQKKLKSSISAPIHTTPKSEYSIHI